MVYCCALLFFCFFYLCWLSCLFFFFFFSSRRRHTRCALVTGVQTCALPIFIKSRKNGGTLLLLAAAAMHVMGASVSAQETPDFEAIRSVDTDIAAIGYRLATANAPLCDRQEQIGRAHV